DPNLISAFAENCLPHDARAQVLEHVAQCADCREILYISLPEQEFATPATQASPSHWLTWPVLRWGAALAAVVVVVAAVSLHRQRGGRAPPAMPIADLPVSKEAAAPVSREAASPVSGQKIASLSTPEVKQDIEAKQPASIPPPAAKNELAAEVGEG